MNWLTVQEIESVMQGVVDNFLIPKFNELGMNASGEWLNSLSVVGYENTGEIKGRPYTEQLANGRMPGSMPPIEPIQKWAELKLGIFGDNARSAAFAIAKKIQQSGTTWYQKGGTDIISILQSPEVIQYVNGRIGDFMSVNVQTYMEQRLKEIFT